MLKEKFAHLLFLAARLVRFIPPFARPHLPICKFQKEYQVKNIFVGNLSFGASEDVVRSLFASYGTVERVSLVTDRETGSPRGFGFVEMSHDGEADLAISAINGRELDGRTLNVNEARPKEQRSSGGGGGYRSNGGGQGRGRQRW